jgi:hypothetical protein
MAQLTEKVFAERIRKKARLLVKENLPLKIASQTIHTLRVNRIFHVGLNASAGKIGNYNSTTELWAADKQLRRAGTHRGKTGKAIKTSYYRSYKELKAQQGFRNDRVNLRMTNNLQSEFANVNISQSNDSPPKNSSPIKVNPNLYIERVDNLGKLKGIEAKYGDVFGFTKGEVTKFYKTYNFEAKKILES